MTPTVRVIAHTRFLEVPPELAPKGIRPDQDQGSEAARLIELAGRCCYDEATEILTDEGWKRFADLSRQERVATLDPDTLLLVYQRPTDYIIREVDEPLVYAQGRRVNFLVTQDHDMFVGSQSGKSWGFVKAKKLLGTGARFYRAAGWVGTSPDVFDLPATHYEQVIANQHGRREPLKRTEVPIRSLPIRPWLAFLGFYLTEGFCYRDGLGHHRITITQREEGMGQIEAVVKELSLSYGIQRDPRKPAVQHLIIHNKQLCDYLSQFGKSHDKHLPRELMGLNRELLSILYEALIEGDGSTTGGGHRMFHTVSRRMADDVQELALKVGLSMTVRHCRSHSPGKPEQWIWRCSENRRQSPTLRSLADQGLMHYRGRVYCVTVPEYHTLYVRRCGIPMWCGNCYDSFGVGRSSAAYHEHIKEVAHGSVLEHSSISFYIEGVSRGCTHELVRHRHAAISQRSTRYVDESQSKIAWHPLIDLLQPGGAEGIERRWLEAECSRLYGEMCADVEELLIARGVDKATARKQARGAARGALPTALSTSLIWTVNIRALRNFLDQRASPFADAEIRLLSNAIYEAARPVVPEYLSDYRREECPDGIGYALTTEHRKL